MYSEGQECSYETGLERLAWLVLDDGSYLGIC